MAKNMDFTTVVKVANKAYISAIYAGQQDY